MKQGWKYIQLSEIVNVINGLWTGKKKPLINVAVIRNTNFSKDCKLNLENVAYIDVEEKLFSSRKLLPGDIIVEKSGGSEKQPVGRPVLFDISEGDYSFSNFTATLRLKNTTFLPSFLHLCLFGHYVNGATRKMQAKTTGLHNLDMKAFLRLPIPLIPLSEQERIVEELDLLSGIIDKQKEQLRELDALAQSIFHDMFGDPVQNEKGWVVKKLGEIFDVKSSKRIYQSEQSMNGVPFLRVADIVNLINGINYTPELFIDNSRYNELDTLGLIPKNGDLLVTSRGTLGKVYIIRKEDCFYFQDGMITWLDNQRGFANSEYTKYLLEFTTMKNEILKSSNISTVAFLSISKLSKLSFPLPPLSLQQQFASKVEAIEEMKAKVRQSLAETETLLSSRMDYYFN